MSKAPGKDMLIKSLAKEAQDILDVLNDGPQDGRCAETCVVVVKGRDNTGWQFLVLGCAGIVLTEEEVERLSVGLNDMGKESTEPQPQPNQVN